MECVKLKDDMYRLAQFKSIDHREGSVIEFGFEFPRVG